MDSLKLSNLQISDICRELAVLLHAGVGAADGLFLMTEEEKQPRLQELLRRMAETVDGGGYLHQAFEEAGCFPAHITGLMRVGEEVGRAEETLGALAEHYEKREQLRRQVVSSLTYPAILLLLMLVVIIILLSQVLPVFNEIYMSLGGRLTGIAGGLLLLGEFLDRILPALCIVLGIGAVLGAALWLHRGARGAVTALWKKYWGDRGIAEKMNNARYAQALSLGFTSGMALDEAAEMASRLLADIPGAAKRCEECRRMLQSGAELTQAMGKTRLLSPAACRLLTLALRGGAGDSAMEQIARRMEEEARQALEDLVARVEPALVLVTSGLVGVILLSVMLPLMNIMTAIG